MAEPNRSHFPAMEEMERAAPGSSLRTGWIDRVLGLRAPANAFQGVQSASNLAAWAFLGNGSRSSRCGRSTRSAWTAPATTPSARWDTALRALNERGARGPRGPGHDDVDALSTTASCGGRLHAGERRGVPGAGLGDALQDVARLIKANVGLQVAAVDYGDWDMHADKGSVDAGWMHDHLGELSDSLAAFATDLGPLMGGVTLVYAHRVRPPSARTARAAPTTATATR